MQACRYQTDCQRKSCKFSCPIGNGTSFCQSKAEVFKTKNAYLFTRIQKYFLDKVIASRVKNSSASIIQPVTLTMNSISNANIVAEMLTGELCNTDWHKSVSLTKVKLLKFEQAFPLDNSFNFTESAGKAIKSATHLVVLYNPVTWDQFKYKKFCELINIRITSNLPVYLVGPEIRVSNLPQDRDGTCSSYAIQILNMLHDQGVVYSEEVVSRSLFHKGGQS